MNASPLHFVRLLAAVLLLCAACTTVHADDEQPIAIAEVQHEGPVDFEKEILPIFTKSCTACHNASAAEGELVLETPQTILKGGYSGPAVVAGNSGESLLMKAAAHQEEPFMPPADNSVEAVDLTGEQLGLIKLWIDQGATGEVTGAASIEWQPLPAGMNPIYAVAMSPDGQIAACSRANQIFVYNLANGALLTRLTDPALVESGLYKQHGVAHLDLVQALAFSPDGDLLASGGYREVKLWRRPHSVRRARTACRCLGRAGDRRQSRRQVGRRGRSLRRDQTLGSGHAQGSQNAGRTCSRRERFGVSARWVEAGFRVAR